LTFKQNFVYSMLNYMLNIPLNKDTVLTNVSRITTKLETNTKFIFLNSAFIFSKKIKRQVIFMGKV